MLFGMEEWVLVDGNSVNDYGYRVSVEGMDLDRFLKNPIMLYNHDSYSIMPIGTWTNVRKADGKLYATPKFSSTKLGKKVKKMVEEGTLKAASVGFNVGTHSSDPEYLIDGQTHATVVTSELYEASIVPMGSDKNAIKLNFKKQGITLSGSYGSEELSGLIPKIQNQKVKESIMKELLKKLGLNEDATEAQAIEAIQKLESDRVDLLLQLGAENNVVTEENKETYRKLANSDFDTTMTLLGTKVEKAEVKKEIKEEEKPEAEITLKSIIDEFKKNGSGKSDENKETFKWLQKNNPEELNRIRLNEPEKYKELAANYGK